MNLLYIHDRSFYAELIIELLRLNQYRVRTASDAKSAHLTLAHMPVDLVLCDLPAQGSDRFALLAELCDRHPSFPVIVLATYGVGTPMPGRLQEYPPYWLIKPFSITALVNLIGDATGTRRPASDSVRPAP